MTGLLAAQAALIRMQLAMDEVDRVYPSIPPPNVTLKPVCWVNSCEWEDTQLAGNQTDTTYDQVCRMLFPYRGRKASQAKAYSAMDQLVDLTSRLPLEVDTLSSVVPRGEQPTITTWTFNGKPYIVLHMRFELNFTQSVNIIGGRVPPAELPQIFTLNNKRWTLGGDGWSIEP